MELLIENTTMTKSLVCTLVFDIVQSVRLALFGNVYLAIV